MRMFRAISYAELQDILATGALRPGPPSFQGKWLAETVEDAAEWGRWLFKGTHFHIVEVRLDDAIAVSLFRLANLDGIGPARYAEIPDLPKVVFIGEVLMPPGVP